MYYDKEGIPISADRFSELFKDFLYRQVAKTDVISGEDTYCVSTVWLGIDYSFLEGIPIIFETLVFKNDYTEMDIYRYATEKGAKEGHTEAVVNLSATLSNFIIVDKEM